MAFKDHFSTQADSYARYRPGYPPQLLQYLASLAPARQLAWDCATGSGQAAVVLGEQFEQVIASDASWQQLQHARPHPRVSYQAASAEAAPMADGSVDLICVAQALHWFDLDAFSSEARRVLKAGGVLAVWSYALAQIDTAIDPLIEHFYRDTVGRWWPAERSLVENAYADIELPFTRVDTPAFAMQAEWTLSQLLGYLDSWSAVQRCRAATGQDPLPSLIDQLAPIWGESSRTRPLRWPLALQVYRSDVS